MATANPSLSHHLSAYTYRDSNHGRISHRCGHPSGTGCADHHTGTGASRNIISTATINGGVITQNSGDGIRVGSGEGFLALPGQSTAAIGLDSPTVIEISQNSGVGIAVEDDGFDSEAKIDSRNIEFIDNADVDTIGNIIDIAP